MEEKDFSFVIDIIEKHNNACIKEIKKYLNIKHISDSNAFKKKPDHLELPESFKELEGFKAYTEKLNNITEEKNIIESVRSSTISYDDAKKLLIKYLIDHDLTDLNLLSRLFDTDPKSIFFIASYIRTEEDSPELTETIINKISSYFKNKDLHKELETEMEENLKLIEDEEL
jgi:hypothetical protein